MKKLRLSRLTLENFKGVDRLEVKLAGSNATIRGENGTGKTTVADAYTWALTGKMTDGRTAEIGCYDLAGRLDTETVSAVEVEFTDGSKFRRESNGSAKFYVDGVPVKATEYASAIRTATSDALGMLVMPQNFCEMHWLKRRQILMTLVNVTNAEVIASAPELKDFAPLVEKREPELIKRTALDERKKLNAELSTIPARIDELQRTARPADSPTSAEIGAQIAELERQIIVKGIQIRKLQEDAKKAKEPFNEIDRLTSLAEEAKNDAVKLQGQFMTNELTLKSRRESWIQTNEAMNGKCPTCGAKVVSDRLPELQRKLDRINQEGTQLAAAQKKLETAIEETTRRVETLRRQIADMKAKFGNADEDAARIDLDKVLSERDEIQNRLNKLKAEFAAIEASEKTAARIRELRRRETEIGGQIAERDKQLYLAEIFTAQQIKLTEAAINSKFKFVMWKMFEPYKAADGVRECCEPMINGVPYSGNLSKGEKLKAALDILGALQRFYGVEFPIFIDDAESYTSNSFVDLPNQTIRLKAAEGVKKLKIDVEKAAEQPRQVSLFEGATA